MTPEKKPAKMTPNPMIKLKDLLHLGFSESPCWITGEDSADMGIGWIVLEEDQIQEGDLLLIPGIDLNLKLMKKALKSGGAAILCVGQPTLSEAVLPPGTPLLWVAASRDIQHIHRGLLTILVNHRAHLMEREYRIHTQLSRLSMDGEGLADLAKAIFDLSGRSVAVQDKRLSVLAGHPAPVLVSIWDEVLAQIVDYENLPHELRDRKQAGQHTQIYHQPLPGGLERIVMPISVGGVARGYLSLIDEKGSLDRLDHLIAEQGALVCGIEMARAKAVREAEKRLKGDLLTALLQENITPRDANLWVQSMGLDPTYSHVAIRFAWTGEDQPSRRRLETLVNGETSRLGVKVLVRALETEVVCFCQVPPNQNRPQDALTISEGVLARGKIEYPDAPICCGLGTLAQNLGSWRDSFRQAGQALEMARRLNEGQPLFFPDLSVYRLLLQLEYHPELKSFKDEILGRLIAYEGGGELIHTLETYFEHNGNLSQAADALFIHRNTLIYRMERIAEITGLDLDNTETRLAVQLALRIHRMTDRD